MTSKIAKFSIVESAAKTEIAQASWERTRDAIGGYTGHARLEHTAIGRRILDQATTIHVAIATAMSHELTATEWSERTGFRSPGDYRKAKCGEHLYNETDIAALCVVDPIAFREFLQALAHEVGARLELLSDEKPASVPASATQAGEPSQPTTVSNTEEHQ